MKNLKKFLVVAVVAIGIVSLNACDTDEINEENVAVTSISDYINISNSFSLNAEEEITNDDEGGFKSANPSDCLTVTIHENENGEVWPRNWTLDYGVDNCEVFNGNLKRGKILAVVGDQTHPGGEPHPTEAVLGGIENGVGGQTVPFLVGADLVVLGKGRTGKAAQDDQQDR